MKMSTDDRKEGQSRAERWPRTYLESWSSSRHWLNFVFVEVRSRIVEMKQAPVQSNSRSAWSHERNCRNWVPPVVSLRKIGRWGEEALSSDTFPAKRVCSSLSYMLQRWKKESKVSKIVGRRIMWPLTRYSYFTHTLGCWGGGTNANQGVPEANPQTRSCSKNNLEQSRFHEELPWMCSFVSCFKRRGISQPRQRKQ
jgi:hypothetical protein